MRGGRNECQLSQRFRSKDQRPVRQKNISYRSHISLNEHEYGKDSHKILIIVQCKKRFFPTEFLYNLYSDQYAAKKKFMWLNQSIIFFINARKRVTVFKPIIFSTFGNTKMITLKPCICKDTYTKLFQMEGYINIVLSMPVYKQ